MLRIVDFEPNIDGVAARLEGQIRGPAVEVVRKYCEQAGANGSPVVLDMQEVSFLDHNAISLFRQLIHQGIRLINLSPFLKELLRQEPS